MSNRDELLALEELKLWRSLVTEGGVPRYTITPGAALNSVVTSTDALIARLEHALATPAAPVDQGEVERLLKLLKRKHSHQPTIVNVLEQHKPRGLSGHDWSDREAFDQAVTLLRELPPFLAALRSKAGDDSSGGGEAAKYEARPDPERPWVWHVWDVTHPETCNHFDFVTVDGNGACDDLHEPIAKRIAASLSTAPNTEEHPDDSALCTSDPDRIRLIEEEANGLGEHVVERALRQIETWSRTRHWEISGEEAETDARRRICASRRATWPGTDDECEHDGQCAECEHDLAEEFESAASKVRRKAYAEAAQHMRSALASIPDVPEGLRERFAREIALAGLGTTNGEPRERPNDKWVQSEWETRILEVSPERVEQRCYALADKLVSLLAASQGGGEERR